MFSTEGFYLAVEYLKFDSVLLYNKSLDWARYRTPTSVLSPISIVNQFKYKSMGKLHQSTETTDIGELVYCQSLVVEKSKLLITMPAFDKTLNSDFMVSSILNKLSPRLVVVSCWIDSAVEFNVILFERIKFLFGFDVSFKYLNLKRVFSIFFESFFKVFVSGVLPPFVTRISILKFVDRLSNVNFSVCCVPNQINYHAI